MIILRIFHGFFDATLNYIFYQCYFDKKKNFTRSKEMVVISVLALADALIKNHFSNVIVTTIVSMIIIYSISFLLFDGKREIKFLVSTIIFLLSILLDYVVSISLSIIYAVHLGLIQKNGFIIIFSTIICWLLKFIIVLNVRRTRLKTTNAGDRSAYIQQNIIPFVSTVFILIFISIELTEDDMNFVRCYATMCTILVINIVHYILFENKEKLYQENYNNLMLQQKYEYREEYYRNVEKYQEEIRVIKHDLKNQLIRITAYDDKRAVQEINLMIYNLVKVDGVSFTKNIGINSILNVKYQEACIKNIECIFNVKLPEFIPFAESDIAGLVGNIIDNAIEGAVRCEGEKTIKFNMFYYNNMLVIRSNNTTDGFVKNFETRKKNQKEHGLGIISMNAVIEKYNGSSEYVIKNNWVEIDISIWGTIIRRMQPRKL